MLVVSREKAVLYAFLWILKLNFGFSQTPPSINNNTQFLDIVGDIQNLRFETAEEKILAMAPNQTTVEIIVNNTYSNSENNTKVILEFAKAATRTRLSFYVLRALRNTMRANSHRDSIKLISLARAFEDEIIYQKSAHPDIVSESKLILNQTKVDIKTSAKEVLKAALFSNNFLGNPYIKNLTSALFNFHYTLDDEVMKEMVNETYPEVPAVQIVENIMFTSNYIPQKVTVLLALYEKLEANNDLNNQGVQTIAWYFRLLRKMQNYRHLFSPKKYAVNEVIKRLPICARNLYFAHDLCIWNRGRSEYLYAAQSQHNLSRRGIFTYEAEDITNGGIWNVDFFENVYFQNNVYQKEYIYASTTDRYNPETRHVLTWVDDGFVGDTSAWTIELHGDFCYIKNVNFDEYLYTSDKMHGVKRRYVFTAITGETLDNPDFQWQLRNCD